MVLEMVKGRVNKPLIGATGVPWALSKKK